MQIAGWQLCFSDRLTGARNPARLPTSIRSRRIRCAPSCSVYYHVCIPSKRAQLAFAKVFPRPDTHAGRQRSVRSVAIVVIIGTLLSMFAFYNFYRRDRQESEKEFNLSAKNYNSAFSREMEGNLSVLTSVASFAEVQGTLNRGNFEPFARKQVESNPDILCLEWLPRISLEERGSFEKKVSQWEERPVQITVGNSTKPKPADSKPVYFPIALMYPRTTAMNVIGFNGYSQREMHSVLDRARDEGVPVATAKFRILERTIDGFAVPVYVPVYVGPSDHSTLQGRRTDLVGYILGILDIAGALERAVSQVPASINIQFYDLSAPIGKRLLYFHRTARESASIQAIPESKALVTEGITPYLFDFASRQWALVCTPGTGAFRNINSGYTWGFLIAGLLCTFCVASYVSLNSFYTFSAQGLVAQLVGINARLKKEISEREKAEEEITWLNASLEKRVFERTEALRESDERYALAAHGSKDGLWDWNFSTRRIYLSQRWKEMLGYDKDEISDDPEEWFRLMHPDEVARVRAEVSAHCSGNTPQFQSEHRMHHKDGGYCWMLSRGVAVLDDRGIPSRMAGSQTDITEGKVADALTGLPNRIFLADKLQNAIERASTVAGGLFAVLFLDLDRFKIVNDSLGHKAGDQLLRAISQRLLFTASSSSLPRHHITVARLGGDEFAVLLAAIKCQEDATTFAAQIQTAMKPFFDLEGRQVFAACSIGVAFGGSQSDPNDIVRDADTAMYVAKSKGKHRYEIFDAAMRERSMERLQLETDLRAAISRNELLVYYQPKVSLSTGQVVEFEALVRWCHPVRGMVQPQDFIPIADETGLILPIGEWVLDAACRQVVDWRRRFGCTAGVSVNISARQFETFDLVSKVRGVLATTGLPASFLSLEITESLLLENPESAIQQLGQLRDLGINLKIDDFGTGFSSLSYLHRLPFNEIKIDRSFVNGMSKTREAAHIVRTIVLLARVLGMSVVAEGVETEEQLLQLAALSCDYGQGNYFSKPLPADIAERFLGPTCPVLLPAALVFPDIGDGLEESVRIQ